MILAHPESDLSLNIMVMGADLIRIMAPRKTSIFVEGLLKEFLKGDKRRTPDMFVNALSFLYAFGYVERVDHRVRLTVGERSEIQSGQIELL